MENKNVWLKKLLRTLPVILITGLILVPVGIVFLCTSHMISVKEQSVDYTDCKLFSFDSDINITCAESMLKENEPCICYYYFNITENLERDLIVYFELESFDQLSSDYINSRDNNQLMGELVQIPSDNCEPYRYDEGNNPISPCGAIADAMCNDTYRLRDMSNDIIVPFLKTGILTDADKVGYHNPVNITDLKNYTKPKNWNKHIWELDSLNPDNNGFQNEIFIGWMKTEWKRKPYARVDKNQTQFERGLSAGEYELRIGYNYPPTRYNGRRKIIFSATLLTYNTSLNVIGIISLVIGLILLAMAIIALVMRKHIKGNDSTFNNTELDAAHENLTNNR